MKLIKDFIARLTSRKFLLTVGTCLTLYSQKMYHELALVVLGYLGVEGFGDAASRYAVQKTVQTKIAVQGSTAVDTDEIVSGIPMQSAPASPQVVVPGQVPTI